MLDIGTWVQQMDHYEMIKNDMLYSKEIRVLSKSEHNEYRDLKLRHNEQLIQELPKEKPIRKAQIPSKKYA